MEPKKVVLMFFIALPALGYWFVYFAPPPENGGEDWAKFGLLLVSTVLCLVALTVSIFFAIKAGNNIAWWLISVLNLTPIIRFFV